MFPDRKIKTGFSQSEITKWDDKYSSLRKFSHNDEKNMAVSADQMNYDRRNSTSMRELRKNQSDLIRIPSFKDFKRLKHVDDINELYDLTTMLG